MSIAVIIAEFNPFHNGHAYLISEAKKLCGHVAVIMSGPFVQRGEPALTYKYRRARAALCAGASLVIELPVLYCPAPAEIYARGAVLTANALLAGRDGMLVFGSESGDISYLKKLADAVSSQDSSFHDRITDALKAGMPYPKAMDIALSAGDDALLSDHPLADSPNDILAAEYIRSISLTGSTLTPVPIKRTSGPDIAHASDIRRAILSSGGRDGHLRDLLPEYSHRELDEISASDTEHTVRADDLSAALGYALCKASPEHLSEICDMSGDLANRILSMRRDFDTFTGFACAVKTRAFTYARISRCLTQLLLGIIRSDRSAALERGATYLRVLGIRDDSRELLGIPSGSGAEGWPLIVRGADLHSERIETDQVLAKMIGLQLFADALYEQYCFSAGTRSAGEEKPPVIV